MPLPLPKNPIGALSSQTVCPALPRFGGPAGLLARAVLLVRAGRAIRAVQVVRAVRVVRAGRRVCSSVTGRSVRARGPGRADPLSLSAG
jgi:hypothetical protein